MKLTSQIIEGDCLEAMRQMPDASVDAIVTDPPYGLSFMGKKWDYDVPSVEVWAECLRVLKPGGHLLAFAGTRTQHRIAVRIEDAGFEIRDMIAWVYGSGFPKSLDVSKAIDKAAGVEGTFGAPKSAAHAGWIERGAMRKVGGSEGNEGWQRPWVNDPDAVDRNARQYIGGTEAARQWQGWGTALKPALEPITVARKPLDGTVAENVLAHGTGALNVDGCRVASGDKTPAPVGQYSGSNIGPTGLRGLRDGSADAIGRWPANLIHDGSQDVLSAFPEAGGAMAPVTGEEPTGHGFSGNVYGSPGHQGRKPIDRRDGGGSAARFFYCAKASKEDRDAGCEGLEAIHRANGNKWTDQDYRVKNGERPPSAESGPRRNYHPTVKPTALMRYLCRLVTPPGGIVLDPFAGSGSTGKAALMEGFNFIGIERDPEYAKIARARAKPPAQQSLL